MSVIINNCVFQIPNEILLRLFSPEEIACVLPYVSKLFYQLANNNDLWNSISIKYRTKHLRLDFPFDYNNAKLSYIMRNIEICNLFKEKYKNFINHSINKYEINFDVFDIINRNLKITGNGFDSFWLSSTLKTLHFMLDFCQSPSIIGYLRPFTLVEINKEAIGIIMKEYRPLLEKEYQLHKALIDRIDLFRIKNNIPIQPNRNNVENIARSIVNIYEHALQIYENLSIS